MSQKGNIKDIENLPESEREREKKNHKADKRTGVYNTNVAMANPFMEVAQNETWQSGPDNGSFIVLGADRPGAVGTGYGGQGATNVSRLDFIVGPASSRKGGIPNNQTMHSPNFFTDAARIYVSQTADIDKYMGLADAPNSKSEARSSFAAKSDVARIHARENVKILTGTGTAEGLGSNGEPNSKGGRIDGVGSISFIAGNYTQNESSSNVNLLDTSETQSNTRSKLQPLAKGDDLVKALDELTELVIQVLQLVRGNTTIHQIHANVTSEHFHICPPVGPSSPAPMESISGGIVRAHANIQLQLIENVRMQLDMMKQNYLVKQGASYINSKHVHTT